MERSGTVTKQDLISILSDLEPSSPAGGVTAICTASRPSMRRPAASLGRRPQSVEAPTDGPAEKQGEQNALAAPCALRPLWMASQRRRG